MAQWPRVAHKIGTDVGTGEMISFGKGINTFLSPYVGQQGAIDKNTSPLIDNSIVYQYPILEPRRGIQKSYDETPTKPFLTSNNGIYQYNSKPVIHDGTKVWIWQPTSSTYLDLTLVSGAVANERSDFVTFKSGGVEYMIFGNSSELRVYNGVVAFPSIADVNKPLTYKLAVDDRRVWGLLQGVLHFSAAGDHTDWTTANDAGQIELTGFSGVDVGITAYQNTVIAWSTQTMHILYGDETDDYYLSDPIDVGLLSHRAVIQHRGILYFLGYDKKIYMYAGGGMPVSISEPVNFWLDAMDQGNGQYVCCAGTYDRWILFSIPVGQGYNTITLVYDADLKIWQKWDLGFIDFININEVLYGFKRNNYFYKLFGSDWTDDAIYGGSDAAVNWNYYTGYWTEGTVIGDKVLTDIYIHYYKPSGSQMAVEYETNASGSFTTLEILAANTIPTVYRVEILPSILYNAKFFRLKFTCQGQGKIFGIEPEYRIKRR